MALFAFLHVSGQTSVNAVQTTVNKSTSINLSGSFAVRQLQYGALLEYNAALSANGSLTAFKNDELSEISLFRLIYGDDLAKNYEELQTYLQNKKFSNVHEFVFSFAKIACAVENQNRFIGHLIRFGMICQVNLDNRSCSKKLMPIVETISLSDLR